MPAATTLVLGAGSSCGYGFPIGRDLRHRILALDAGNASVCEELQTTANDLRAFLEHFYYAQTDSIDEFLAERGEYSGVGKAAVAKILLHCERGSALFDHAQADPWYQYLLRTLTAGGSWDEFDPSWLSVVTFNYDRSLEWFLYKTLMSRSGKPESEVIERLNRIKIHHVYGSLDVPWLGDGYVPYAPSDRDLAKRIPQAASYLKVIPEGRDDDPSLNIIRQCLQQAERICFLGFAFDQTNLRRIGAPEIFLLKDGVAKNMVATCYGLTDAETNRAFRRIVGREQVPSSHHFQNAQCTHLLRTTLILD